MEFNIVPIYDLELFDQKFIITIIDPIFIISFLCNKSTDVYRNIVVSIFVHDNEQLIKIG